MKIISKLRIVTFLIYADTSILWVMTEGIFDRYFISFVIAWFAWTMTVLSD